MSENRKPRIGWILTGDRRFASSRIHGYNIHDYLLSKGIDSRIVSSPAVANCALQFGVHDRLKLFTGRYDLVIFQKVYDDKAVALARNLQKLRVKTVFLLCDLVETPMIYAVDHVIVTSQTLASWVYRQFGVTTEIIDDAIEIPDNFRAEGSGAGLPTGVWIGSKDNWGGISRVLKMIRSFGLDKLMEVVTISDHDEAAVAWSKQNVLRCCRLADFSLLPVDDTLRARVKSSNRLAMFLSMGLPVLAERIPAYEDLSEKTGGVVFAGSDKEWQYALENILNQRYRDELVGDAADKVRELLDISVIGERWVDCLSDLLARRAH